MKIRKYREEDKESVKELVQNSLDAIYGSFNIKWEDFRNYIVFFVVEEDEKIVGCASIKKTNNGWAKLKRMYVLPKVQRKGIGKELLEYCIDFCEKNNFKKVILTTYSEMEDGIEFYKKNGFIVIENPGDEYFTNPKLKEYNSNQVAMEREL